MTLHGIILAVTLKIICVQSRVMPLSYLAVQPVLEDYVTPSVWEDEPKRKASSDEESETKQDSDFLEIKNPEEGTKFDATTPKPCSVVVLSDIRNHNMRSLLRKYRYDRKGLLIPESVKYFIKLPQGLEAPPILVPLNDQAFSPLGGFVRYYKEVPPIPQSW